MKRIIGGCFITLMLLVIIGCPNDPPIPSTIVFADGEAVTRLIDSGPYTNAVSGAGDGAITYSSGTPATATVNASTGEVTPAAVGTTVITASKAETATHSAVSASYTLTVEADYTSANIGTLKYVPAGTFQRDSTTGNTSAVSIFRISTREITRAQFTAMLTTDPSNATFSSGTSDPVNYITWYQTIAFCNKLSLAEGLTPVYAVSGVDFSTLVFADIPTSSPNANWDAVTATWSNNGYRLPTEMEWMWAAMGAPADGQNGGVNTTGYTKPFAGSTGSNSLWDYAVFGYSSGETGAITTNMSQPVGSKLPNEIGLYDMSGNAYEWTWDWNGSYPTGALTDYRGPASGSDRVTHGGSWGNSGNECPVAFRDYGSPSGNGYVYGFRVARR